MKVITQHNLGQYADDHAHGLRGVHLALEERGRQRSARCTMHVLRRAHAVHTRPHAMHAIRMHVHMHMPCTCLEGSEVARRIVALIVLAHADVLAIAVVVRVPVLEAQVLVRVRVRLRSWQKDPCASKGR